MREYGQTCNRSAGRYVILLLHSRIRAYIDISGYNHEVEVIGLAYAGIVTEEIWQAIVNNDSSYNDKFFYAVRTTGIFCRPSCRSKPPNRENVRLFEHAEQALAARFRPCKRCKPTGRRLPDEEWIGGLTAYIEEHYREALTLEILAELSHGSPYHLHRTFKRITGLTPVLYIQQLRIHKAKEQLLETEHSVAVIGTQIGMPNTSYFVTLFKKLTGHTPTRYRQLAGRS
jgi:AraC family transcriptional regulator, regulatory protein of adaptative response / methylphosphotriester-DNA alkyltransferase methyltransferase